MRLSQIPWNTLKETPADAEVVSHQLLLRAGLVRRLTAGIFTWMPFGLKVLRKVEAVVREEMNRAGAVEVLMPAVQPAELWQETGRWDRYGDLLLRIRDRHERDYCFGPTHEEVITEVARRELRSYRQLPVNYYQIQTKFRDEIRPRFGLMRAREFIMKDAYSFHLDQASLETTYQAMAEAYARIFRRLGLRFRSVEADSGEIGGARSQEFHVLAESGEDAIAWCDGDSYAANIEMAAALPPSAPRPDPSAALAKVATPKSRSIDEVAAELKVAPERCVKILVVEGTDGGVVALALRGDHSLNAAKAQRLSQVKTPLTLASPERVTSATGAPTGFVGPVGLRVPLIADHSALAIADFVAGANEAGFHHTGVNWGRDTPVPAAADLRNVVAGDPSPGGGGALAIARGIEVGHIFQLGDKYSRAMNAVVLDEDGKERPTIMGCYGIGVSRIVAAAIEQNHDANGIVWPGPMSPFDVTLLVLNPKNAEAVTAAAESIYVQLSGAGLDVLLDDRDARPGVKFAEADLLGVPHRLVVGDRGVREGLVEYRNRASGAEEKVAIDDVGKFILARLSTAAAA
ncbi:MAG: proline--tRNA ligase [Gammaproteobacteria bacterium]|nr:proline--tRNA ligase [Gammaproteobacteria bacterium]